MRLNPTDMGRNQMHESKHQTLQEQIMIQRNRDAMLLENMIYRNYELGRKMAAQREIDDNHQQTGTNQMEQLMNHKLENAVENHRETGKNMMEAMESQEELGQILNFILYDYAKLKELFI